MNSLEGPDGAACRRAVEKGLGEVSRPAAVWSGGGVWGVHTGISPPGNQCQKYHQPLSWIVRAQGQRSHPTPLHFPLGSFAQANSRHSLLQQYLPAPGQARPEEQLCRLMVGSAGDQDTPGWRETSTRGYKTVSFDRARGCRDSERGRRDLAGLCTMMPGASVKQIGDGR